MLILSSSLFVLKFMSNPGCLFDNRRYVIIFIDTFQQARSWCGDHPKCGTSDQISNFICFHEIYWFSV